MEDKIIFKRCLGPKGNTTGISIPKELQEYLNADDNSCILMYPDTVENKKCIIMILE